MEGIPTIYTVEEPRSKPPTFVERYFKTSVFPYQRTNPPNDKFLCEDVLVAQHSNLLYVIFLADSHSIVQRKEIVTQINPIKWDPSTVHGKRKKGGRAVQPRTIICSIMTQSGTEYLVPAGVQGSLVEFNWRLASEPSLLLDKRKTEGYIAVILPKSSKKSGNQ
ncbi:Protein Simiate [Galdieria sulphuraria]|uniref:Protein Abitram n=1 Tax=Galdieria sulphuraria TaxID=130081 RepID=M2W067_GALSU|nr:uncharacterized protein Gasu_35760 [Galdieria sulphuraria]EME29006.1 hypothetical protein Gasu_35760 [Galdieria sulphuraria]GJD06943.1 Protein Simiate [Galdieria sulphuraria]|eukprot:XP_005705526.1 hypothetical protein Gasu_35760 [Galdieria sulphuraria]